ncbi:MAG: hypothetical protein JOZ69_04850 [Myxococcales bacterium]|nr:hypothetical protein [Myxococcales bacterium]
MLARRHFGAGAIALALLGFGLGRRVVDIRACVGGHGETAGWATLRRWVHAAGSGLLWREARASPPGWGSRAVAQRVAMTLAACAPGGVAYAGVDEQVFAGAAHAA